MRREYTVKAEMCAYCGEMTDLPFECSYCKDPFCAEHRLPEEHRCVKLTQIRSKEFGKRGVIRDGGRDRPNILRRIWARLRR
ncbi:nucleic acid binding protein containing the AN1-type Zn-finger [Cenarchaeum symbiosum A]|uniref:Nucleic acid binding protein containing the AN1-type Zn-finger n=1 Tax=Cenarchaeum symbiosum (strain A) TaxID=414004 RepID=A0RYP9_CENSY|nr:nucleic acid binding protein containing the AN1-type Zn-finger [Cenarchaeum symbiosum A]